MLEGQRFPPAPSFAMFIHSVGFLDSTEIGAAVEYLIAKLDRDDGDPDLEEDDFGEPIGDERDLAYPEWHSRGRHKLTADGCEGTTYLRNGWEASEDDENDDPREEDDAAEEDDESGGDNAEDDFHLHHYATRYSAGPGCPIADPGGAEIEEGV